MSNNLTGDYDAVVEVRVKAINGILATLHQNRLYEHASPTFMHRFAIRIGDLLETVRVELVQAMQWMAHSGVTSPGEEGAEHGFQAFTSKSPPGVSAGLATVLHEAHEAQLGFTNPASTTVDGVAQVQLGTPEITFPPNTTTEVTAHVQMRANYIPDPGTSGLPAPVHGEVEVTFAVQPGQGVLEVQIPADDNKIQFKAHPGTGLTNAEVITIERHVRKVLRKNFEPITAELPQDFQFGQFKALDSGAAQVVALPLQLGNQQPSPSAINSVNTVFLGSGHEFAIGIGKEFVLSLVQPTLDDIKSSHPTFTVSNFLGSATYTTTFTQASAAWLSDKIRIQIQGHANTPTWWAPNVSSFSITQDIGFELEPLAQAIDVKALGQPSVSVNVAGPFGDLVESIVTPTVKSTFNAQLGNALAAAESDISQILSGPGSISGALHPFDDSASAKLESLETTVDGVILRGGVTTKLRSNPIVGFTETGDGDAFTALKSWIPAGTIDTFTWSWLENPTPYIPWSTQVKTVQDDHRFVLPKPSGISFTSQICLHIKGTQVYPGQEWNQAISIGDEIVVEAGETCSSSAPGWMIATMPAWWDKIMTPIWLPDPPPEAILDDRISGHVSVLADSATPEGPGINSVVFFSDLRGESPFDVMNSPLSTRRGRSGIPIALVLVVPRGTFRQQRAELEKKLGTIKAFSGLTFITEDYEGGWSRTFGAEKAPATFLINARGEFVWSHLGALDVKSFVRALDQHLIPGQMPVPRSIQPAVQAGERAPDALFDVICRDRLALRKLRGRRVMLNFWQSWSTPCIKELRRLQRLQEQSIDGALSIVAVNGGESLDRIAQATKDHALNLPLVHDPHQHIARKYGVECWPTTISIHEDGFVDGIQVGVTDERPDPTGASYW